MNFCEHGGHEERSRMVERELLADIWIENHRKLVSSVRFTDCTQTHQVRKRSTSTTKLQWFWLAWRFENYTLRRIKNGTKWASADIGIAASQLLTGSLKFTKSTQTRVRKRSHQLEDFLQHSDSTVNRRFKIGMEWDSAGIYIEIGTTDSLKFTKSTQTQVRKRSHQLEEFIQHENLVIPYSGDSKLVQNEILHTLVSNSRNYRFPKIHRIHTNPSEKTASTTRGIFHPWRFENATLKRFKNW